MEAFAKLLEGISSIAWPVLLAIIVFSFRVEVRRGISALLDRIRAGGRIKLGIVEFDRIERVAVSGQPVREREVGRVAIRTNKALQKEIVAEQDRERFAFLVHYAYPLDMQRDEYDVILYMVGHFNRLEHVKRVEYFLGEAWDNAVFVCADRPKGFAIKVSAVGSFLAMARIYFEDGGVLTQSRFVELEPVY